MGSNRWQRKGHKRWSLEQTQPVHHAQKALVTANAQSTSDHHFWLLLSASLPPYDHHTLTLLSLPPLGSALSAQFCHSLWYWNLKTMGRVSSLGPSSLFFRLRGPWSFFIHLWIMSGTCLVQWWRCSLKLLLTQERKKEEKKRWVKEIKEWYVIWWINWSKQDQGN